VGTAHLTWTFPTTFSDPAATPLPPASLSFAVFDTASPTPAVPILSFPGGYTPGAPGSVDVPNLAAGSAHGFSIVISEGGMSSTATPVVNVTMPAFPPNPATNFNVTVA
jgi:hypothetical protein